MNNSIQTTTHPKREWVRYDPNTHTYRTGDDTVVAAELVDNVACLADVFHIADIRATQRGER